MKSVIERATSVSKQLETILRDMVSGKIGTDDITEQQLKILLVALRVNLAGLEEAQRKQHLHPSERIGAEIDRYVQGLEAAIWEANGLLIRIKPETEIDYTQPDAVWLYVDGLLKQVEQMADKTAQLSADVAELKELSQKKDLRDSEFTEMTSVVRAVWTEIAEIRTEEILQQRPSGLGVDHIERTILDILGTKNVLGRITENLGIFKAFLVPGKSEAVTKENFFLVLRRWNSFTPTLSTPTRPSKGGGYFFAWHGKGIVIDPGFDFVENFLSQDLKFDDVDAIMITHAHIDHCADLESLLTLLHRFNREREEEKQPKKSIDLFMNLGSFRKYSGWISLRREDINLSIYSLEPGSARDLQSRYALTLEVERAQHSEVISDQYSVGLTFKLNDNFCLGLTSDTGWDREGEIGKQYKDCKLLIVHLGSIKEEEFANQDFFYENHLGIRGTVRLIDEVRPDLVVISEFGEEFSEGLRIDVTDTLDRVFRKEFGENMRCLVGDIGLKITLPDLRVHARTRAGKRVVRPCREITQQLSESILGKIEYRVDE